MQLQQLPNETANDWHARISGIKVHPCAIDYADAAASHNTEGRTPLELAHDRHFYMMVLAAQAADREDELAAQA